MKTKILLPAVIVLMSRMPGFATSHTINFGGGLGLAYSPSSLSVKVGDTITLEGDFSRNNGGKEGWRNNE